MSIYTVAVLHEGTWDGLRNGVPTSGKLTLTIIRIAWDKGCDFEDLADGFGQGLGTMGDWSAIRDSSDNAVNQMLGRALTYLSR